MAVSGVCTLGPAEGPDVSVTELFKVHRLENPGFPTITAKLSLVGGKSQSLGPRSWGPGRGPIFRLPWKAECVKVSEAAASILEATSKHLKPREGSHHEGGWPVWAPREHVSIGD